MDFEASRNELVEAVVNAANGIPVNPVHPVRAGMWIQAKDGVLTFLGSDGDVTFTATLKNEPIFAEGEVIVPGRLFSDIVKVLPGEDIQVTSDGQAVIIHSGNSRFSLRAIKDQYPISEKGDPDILGKVPGNDLVEAITKISPAVSKNDANAKFTGMLLESEVDVITVAASSPYRMAVCTARWQPTNTEKNGRHGKCLVPGWVMDRFRRGINSDLVSVGWDDSTVVLQSDGFTMTARLLAADFPEWRNFFPDVPRYQVDAGILAEVVKRAKLAIFADEPLELLFQDHDLYVEAGVDERFSEVMACGYTGEAYRARVGSQLFLDAILACDGDTTLGFTGEAQKPMQVTSGNYRSVVVTRRTV